MPFAFGLPVAGYLTLDKELNPKYSVLDVEGGMPVFSPPVVSQALNTAFAKGLDIAVQYHVAKADEYLEAKNYVFAKIHADAADAIKAEGAKV